MNNVKTFIAGEKIKRFSAVVIGEDGKIYKAKTNKPYDKSEKVADYVFTIAKWVADVMRAWDWVKNKIKGKKKSNSPIFYNPHDKNTHE